MYVVVQDELGDTTDGDESAENVYITTAGPATDPPSTVSVGGDGTVEQYTAENGITVTYENRPIRRGRTYYFFVRLYSDVVGDEGGGMELMFCSHCRIKELSMTVIQR